MVLFSASGTMQENDELKKQTYQLFTPLFANQNGPRSTFLVSFSAITDPVI
jgi:hypothetical protein